MTGIISHTQRLWSVSKSLKTPAGYVVDRMMDVFVHTYMYMMRYCIGGNL